MLGSTGLVSFTIGEKILAGLEWGNKGATSQKILTIFFSVVNCNLKNNKIQENSVL